MSSGFDEVGSGGSTGSFCMRWCSPSVAPSSHQGAASAIGGGTRVDWLTGLGGTGIDAWRQTSSSRSAEGVSDAADPL